MRIHLQPRERAALALLALDGATARAPWQMEVSGFHHNVFNISACGPPCSAQGPGEVVARNFSYHGETR